MQNKKHERRKYEEEKKEEEDRYLINQDERGSKDR